MQNLLWRVQKYKRKCTKLMQRLSTWIRFFFLLFVLKKHQDHDTLMANINDRLLRCTFLLPLSLLSLLCQSLDPPCRPKLISRREWSKKKTLSSSLLDTHRVNIAVADFNINELKSRGEKQGARDEGTPSIIPASHSFNTYTWDPCSADSGLSLLSLDVSLGHEGGQGLLIPMADQSPG